jgi:hypothetical protein
MEDTMSQEDKDYLEGFAAAARLVRSWPKTESYKALCLRLAKYSMNVKYDQYWYWGRADAYLSALL